MTIKQYRLFPVVEAVYYDGTGDALDDIRELGFTGKPLLDYYYVKYPNGEITEFSPYIFESFYKEVEE